MPTGPQTFAAVKSATEGKPPDFEYWLTVNEKLDLCKLTATELANLGFEQQTAKALGAALTKQDLEPLGNAMGLHLRVRFRVLADRDESAVRVRCDKQLNAEWMRDYLRKAFSKSTITGPEQSADNSAVCVKVTFDAEATPFALRRALLDCPAATVVQVYDVRVFDQPHYRIEAQNLAAWLEDQNEDEPWWTIDGDPLLMSRLEFPAPPDELASELRKIDKPLLVADPSGTAGGEELTPEEVDQVITSDEWGNRMLMVSWEDGPDDWQMIEDEPTSEGSSE